jgi:hypothetical protein
VIADGEMPGPPEGYGDQTPLPFSEQEVYMGGGRRRRGNSNWQSDWRNKKRNRNRYKWREFQDNYENMPPDIFEMWGPRPPWYPDDMPWPPPRPQWLDPNTSWPPPRPHNLDPSLPWPPPHWYDPEFVEEFPEWMDPTAQFPPPRREWVDQKQSTRPRNWDMERAAKYWDQDKGNHLGMLSTTGWS